VKLQFSNNNSVFSAQRSVDGARRGVRGYSVMQTGSTDRDWPLSGGAHALNGEPDSFSPELECPSRRTSSKIKAITGGLWIDEIKELNQLNAPALLKRVNAVLTNAVKIIVLDFSQTDFLDSHGLGALISLRNMMGRRGGVVRLLNPSRRVERVLELTRLHRVLDIVKCEEHLVG
jgi:anti-anti-sigma factor